MTSHSSVYRSGCPKSVAATKALATTGKTMPRRNQNIAQTALWSAPVETTRLFALNRRHLQPRIHDEDKSFAVLTLQGTESLEQDGNRTIIGPGDFAVYDATRPHQLSFTESWRQIIVSVPRASLDQRVMNMERRIATRVSTDTPTGRVMRMFLQSIAGQIGQFTAAENLGRTGMRALGSGGQPIG